MPSRFLIGLCLCGSLSLASGAVVARELYLPERMGTQPTNLMPSRTERLSPHEAARIAQQQNGGGRVLAVDRNDGGYRVKLLKNGDVRIVYVPG